MEKISSKENSKIKYIKKLKEKKYRNQYNEYIVEGMKLIEEAIKENAKIKKIVVCDDFYDIIECNLKSKLEQYDCISVPGSIFKLLTDVETPQGILAVIEKSNLQKDIKFDEDIIVVLDDVQDPGNVGTILRTIDSAGLTQVLVSKGTADVYNSKVIRSTMGAIFRVNVVECEDLTETIKTLQQNDFKVIATSLDGTKSIYDIDFKRKVIIAGNEANGVSKEIQNLADEKAIIQMLGSTESLNVAVATGVVIYEYVRQKVIAEK